MTNTFITDNINIKTITNTSLALGFFDGIHKGHQKVLNSALEYAKKLGSKSTVLTFKNHPVEVLYNVVPEFITTSDERVDIFKSMGFDNIIMAEFNKNIANLIAKDYFEKIIMQFSPKSISVGYNHKFGANQTGDINFLENMSKNYNFILDVTAPVKQKEEVTSSTLIRNLIKSGNLEKAHLLLQKPYKLKNVVIKGEQRGRLLNFPTANIEFPKNKIIPKFGVYIGFAIIDGKKYNSIANIGLRPTFDDISIPLTEIHIFDFDKDIYGKTIDFEILKLVRGERKFSSQEKLVEQIKIDIETSKVYFEN